jgi:hypothetical protein
VCPIVTLHYAEIGPSSDGPRNYRTQPERVESVSQNHLQTSVPNLHYADIGSSSDAPNGGMEYYSATDFVGLVIFFLQQVVFYTFFVHF